MRKSKSERSSSKVQKSPARKLKVKKNVAGGTSGKSYFDYYSHVQPKVDNKTPAFSIDAYYKPRSLVADAQAIMKIDAGNLELIKKLNTIHRMGGFTDCWNREFNNVSRFSKQKTEFIEKTRENEELMTKIDQVSSLYSAAELIREWKQSRAAKESSKSPSNVSKSVRSSKNVSLKRAIHDHTRPRCYFEIEIESNHRKLGKLVFQLFNDIVPITCDNFISFCRGFNGLSYLGTPFHRIVPGYWCQGGDVLKFNGAGETSIYGNTFEDENFVLNHSERGILSTSGFEKNSNSSKFNLTFDCLETLNGKRVVFGKVIDGINTLKMLGSYGTRSGKPTVKIVVSKCGVL